MVKFGGHNLNGFTPNSTGRIQPGMKYWSNWVEIHWDYIVCLPGQIGYHPNESNWHLSQWIYSQFDRAWNTAQNGCKFTEITFVCLPVHSMAAWLNLVVLISMDLLPIRLVEFDWAWNTGQIGLKFTEITLYASLVELGIISMDLHPIWLGINYWSNWVEIHWD